MKKTTRRVVMVAVRELDKLSKPLIKKACQLAKPLDATLHVVHVIAIPFGFTAAARADLVRTARQQVGERKERLKELVSGAALKGTRMSIDVVWDYPASEAIVREVLRYKPLMLIAESRQQSRLKRLWLTNTDWELIRQCPCPLWLSKSNRKFAGGTVLAAVDPLHTHGKTAAIDNAVLRQAVEAADGRPERVAVCHALHVPQPVVMDGIGMEPYWVPASTVERNRFTAQVTRLVTLAARRHGIPAENVTVVSGDPAVQIPRIARKIRAEVVVMGAVSRGALKRILIGHTAERLIDQLECDVLIVKPRGFRTDVKRSAVRLV